MNRNLTVKEIEKKGIKLPTQKKVPAVLHNGEDARLLKAYEKIIELQAKPLKTLQSENLLKRILHVEALLRVSLRVSAEFVSDQKGILSTELLKMYEEAVKEEMKNLLNEFE